MQRHSQIGGIAVGVHTGVPRATIDVDFAVPSGDSKAAIVTALETAGFVLIGEHAHSLNFRHTSGEPVKVAFDLEFDAMIDRAERMTVAAVAVYVVRKDDLIRMKERAAADPARRRSKALRDLADLALLRGDVAGPDEGW